MEKGLEKLFLAKLELSLYNRVSDGTCPPER